MRKCSSLNSVGPSAIGVRPAETRCAPGSRRTPAQHRLDARQQLARRERLGHVVVGSRFEAGDLVGLRAARGQDDDRNMPRAFLLTQHPRERHARHAREHPVDERKVGQRVLHRAQGGLGVGRADRAMTGVLQVYRDQILDSGLVLDDQNVHQRT
jgi:hypothetical protein